MYKANARKRRHITALSKGQRGGGRHMTGDGMFDFLSKKIINPATRKFTKTMIAHKFGDRYAEAIDKAMEREFKKNPRLVLQRLTDKDFWEKSFKTTHEFLKNDKTLKKFKKPIGDALNAIPVVGAEMKTGWEKLTKDEGKAKETDLAEDLNKSVRKIKAQEKLFKKYGISPPPIAIGYASAEGYKKALDEYLLKNKKQLMMMAQEGGSEPRQARLSELIRQSTGLRPPYANLIAQYTGQQLFDVNDELPNGYYVYDIDRSGRNPTITIQRTSERGFRNRPRQRLPLNIDSDGNESFMLSGQIIRPGQEVVSEEESKEESKEEEEEKIDLGETPPLLQSFSENSDLGDWGIIESIDQDDIMTIRNNTGRRFTARILTDIRGNEYIRLSGQIIRPPGPRRRIGRGMRGGASAYWNCANTAPSCKKLYKGMKEYHACARKKGCRNREISRAEADRRFLEIEEEVKRSNEPVEIVAPSRRGRRRR